MLMSYDVAIEKLDRVCLGGTHTLIFRVTTISYFILIYEFRYTSIRMTFSSNFLFSEVQPWFLRVLAAFIKQWHVFFSNYADAEDKFEQLCEVCVS